MAASISKQLPENMDYDGTAKILSVEPSPLNTVLLQEVSNGRLSESGILCWRARCMPQNSVS